jgi:hypothetical protein
VVASIETMGTSMLVRERLRETVSPSLVHRRPRRDVHPE